jgi:hypothetical protein
MVSNIDKGFLKIQEDLDCSFFLVERNSQFFNKFGGLVEGRVPLSKGELLEPNYRSNMLLQSGLQQNFQEFSHSV